MTKQSDYGIVLMTRMAQMRDQVVNASDLAEDTALPLPTVSKVLKLLARAGLLESQRGAHGGYILSQHPEEISVADVIAALEGPIAITECVDDAPGECSHEASCRIRENWQVINRAIREALEEISLAEMKTSMHADLVTLGGGPVGQPVEV